MALMPLRPGMLISITTTSGVSANATSTASSPSQPLRRPRYRRPIRSAQSPARKSGSSSAMRTYRRVHHAGSAAGRRGRDDDERPAAGLVADLASAADSAARSFIECSPIPLDPIERPVPLSAISSLSVVDSTATRTLQICACACRLTFVSASWAIQ